MKSAQGAFSRYGLQPVIEAPIDMSKLDALASTTEQIAKTHPGAIIMITAGKASSAFIRAYLKTGERPQFFGVSVLSAKALIADLGDDAHGIVIAQVVPHLSAAATPSPKSLLLQRRKSTAKTSLTTAWKAISRQKYLSRRFDVPARI
ncbi:MAG: hypothetical protein M5R42_09365 [Rhodocyclaceae bacterium]|nr:hypothetical protein [Rhodocyclaceae bacterium]